MLLHVQDALQQGHKKILLRTVDTGVLALAVAFLQQVTDLEHLDLWVAFGTGNNFDSGTLLLMRLPQNWAQKSPRLYMFSMPLQVVTLCLVSEIEGRKQR